MNLASKYSNKVDERFTRDSQARMGTNKDYDWNGVNSINVYQVDTVPLTDYTRSGANRYGSPSELGNTIQTMTLTRDRSFTFTIDKGNKNETMMVMDAGKSLAREQKEVIIPEYDAYIFGKQGSAAVTNGQFEVGAASTTTAYGKFLSGSEVLGNKNVPDTGRIAYCSYRFANLMMQDPAFMKYSDKSQDMVIKGVLGEVDGTKIVKVPASRLPFGCSFLLVHPCATVAPEQLNEYKIHQDAPGISGWLVEGRLIYDAFVLNGKKDALYIAFLEGELGTLACQLDDNGKITKIANYDHYVGGKFQIKTGTTLPAYGDANTGYSDVTVGTTTVAADSILVYSINNKIVAACLIDVA